MTRRFGLFGLVALGWVLAASPAAAQVPALGERAATGRVVDSVSGRALSGADLYFDRSRAGQWSDNEGRFRLEHLAAGDTLLVIRRIGYVPALHIVPVSASAALIDLGTVYLKPVATELDRIAVEAEEVRIMPHLADFYRRKQERLPGGEFITREDIQRAAARKTSDALRRSAKIEMDCPNVRLGDDACTARNRRGRDVRLAGSTRARNPLAGGTPAIETTQGDWSFDRCEMDVFVDGERSTLQVDEIPVAWIAGIELYSSAATSPAAFGIARCGVIAIWTTRAGGGQ